MESDTLLDRTALSLHILNMGKTCVFVFASILLSLPAAATVVKPCPRKKKPLAGVSWLTWLGHCARCLRPPPPPAPARGTTTAHTSPMITTTRPTFLIQKLSLVLLLTLNAQRNGGQARKVRARGAETNCRLRGTTIRMTKMANQHQHQSGNPYALYQPPSLSGNAARRRRRRTRLL